MRHLRAWLGELCLATSENYVVTSHTCVSTNLLCLRASGRVSGVPDVPTGGWQNAPSRVLTAYFDSLRIWKQSPERRRVRSDLNSVSGFMTELSCIAANQ